MFTAAHVFDFEQRLELANDLGYSSEQRLSSVHLRTVLDSEHRLELTYVLASMSSSG